MAKHRGVRARALPLAAGLAIAMVAAVPGTSSVAQAPVPGFAKAFSPATIGPGSTTTLRFTVDNTDVVPVTGLAFTDALPAAITIATPANVVNGCGGTVSAPGGGGLISLADGSVAPGVTCTIDVDVTSSTVGVASNVSSALTSSAGASPAATADLTVTTALPGFTKSFATSPVPLGHRSTLTFTLDNSLNASGVSAFNFVDELPLGMVVADPSGASTDCRPAALPAGFTTLTAVPGASTVSFGAFGSSPLNEVVGAGASCTIAVDVVAGGVGTRENSSGPASVSVANGATVAGGKANASLVVTAPTIHLVKEFTDDPVLPGSTVTLRFTINNRDRDRDATGVAFSDDLGSALAGLVAIAPLPADPCGAGSSLSGADVLVLSGGVIPAEGSCAFDVTLAVPAGSASRSNNTTGTVSGILDGSPVTGNVAFDDLFVVTAPVLSKAFSGDPQGAGGTLTLDFTITNPDPDNTMTEIEFEDVLDPVLPAATVVAGTPAPPPPASVVVNNVCGAGSTLTYTPLNPFADPTTLVLADGSLAAGDSCSFTVELRVAATAQGGLYTNTTSPISATLLGATVEGPAATDDFVVVGAPPVRKAFLDDPVAPGGTVELEFTVVNGGEGENDFDSVGPVDDIAFTDDLTFVSGLTAVSPLPSAPCGPGSTLTASASDTLLTLADGNLAQDESCTFSVTVQTSTTTPQGLFENTTSEVSAIASGIPVTGAGAGDLLVVTELAVTKEFTDDPVLAGDLVTLDFSFDNAGVDDVTAIEFGDDIDAALEGLVFDSLVSDDCGGTLVGTASLSYSGGAVAAGSSCTISVSLLVPAGAEADVYSNATSPISADIGGSAVVLPAVFDDLVVVDPPTVGLAKSFLDDPVAAGANVTLRFTLSNPSLIDITGIQFTDDLALTLQGLVAAGLPAAGCGGMVTGSAGDTLLTFSGGSVLAGGVCTVDVTLAVPEGAAPGSYPNTTSAVGADGGLTGDPATDNLDVATPDPQDLRADLSITKSDDVDPVPAGDTLVYTIDVFNAGPDTATGVVVDDILPPAGDDGPPVTLLSTAGCDNGTFTLTCELGDIASGGAASFTITVLVSEGTAGTITNTATVSSDVVDVNLSNNTATQDTLVVGEADLSITKTDSPDPVVAGGQLTYTIEVGNAGPATAVNVVVTDVLPAGVSNPATVGCANDPGGVPGCSLGSIAAGDTTSFTITVDVDASTAGSITNTASVESANVDPDTSDNSTSEDTFVRNGADLSIEKVDDVDPIEAHSHERLTYTITVSNLGPFEAEDVVVTDTLPAGIQFKETVGCAEDKTGVPTCSLGDIAAGASASYTVEVKMKTQSPLGIMTNTAEVTSATLDQDLANNTATEDTLVCRKKTDFQQCGEVEVFSPLGTPTSAGPVASASASSPASSAGSASASSPASSAGSAIPASSAFPSLSPGVAPTSSSTVSAAPPPAASASGPASQANSLPATGSNSTSPITTIALWMLAAGLGFLTLGRTGRRRPAGARATST